MLKSERVVAMFIGASGSPLQGVEEALAVVGRGLEGDRYFHKTGTFSTWPGQGREVTLIEIETIESLDPHLAIETGKARRNLVTRGVRLSDLVGCEFRVGEAVLRGVRLCDPCGHLEKLTRPGIMQALQNKGGLRADVVVGGNIRVGDALTLSGYEAPA
jgi:MOSC domain-containing protein YiiM